MDSSEVQDQAGSPAILHTWDIVAVVGYFVLILGVGISTMFRPNRNTVSGFFLAGRHMWWLPVGASLFASNIGSEHFIGLSGTGAASGIAVGAFEFNALVLLQLLGFVFLPVYIASKVHTLPEYMMKRFGGQRIRMYLAALSMILYIFTKISVNLYSGALFIQQALQWNLYLSIFALLTLTSICTIGGGLTAVIYIDVVQVVIMIAGSGVLLFKGLDKVGGWDSLQTKYMQAVPRETFINPNNNQTCGFPGEDSWQILRAPIGSDMPWPGFLLGQTPASIWYWCADQIMVQKALSAKSLSHAQGATILCGWIKVLPLFLIVIPGMISRVLYPDEIGCVDPDICQKICQNPVSCSNIAYPKLVMGIMPEGMRGIMISVMLAALMSDLTSIFNSASTLFTMDVYRKFRPDAKNKELLLVGRFCIVALVCVSIAWIPLIQQMQGGQLYIYIQSIAAYLSPPIAMVFCMAILWPRMNERGAFWSLMVGLVIGVARMVSDFSFPAPLCMETDTRPFIVSQVHYMYFAAFLFWITGVVALIVSLATPPDEKFQAIRTTFVSRRSKEARPDDEDDLNNLEIENREDAEAVELEALNAKKSTDLHQPDNDDDEITEDDHEKNSNSSSSSPKLMIVRRLRKIINQWLLCKKRGERRNTRSGSNNQQRHETIKAKADPLEQTTMEKCALYINLFLILTGAVALYVYFSINPFTSEEIAELRSSLNVSVNYQLP